MYLHSLMHYKESLQENLSFKENICSTIVAPFQSESAVINRNIVQTQLFWFIPLLQGHLKVDESGHMIRCTYRRCSIESYPLHLCGFNNSVTPINSVFKKSVRERLGLQVRRLRPSTSQCRSPGLISAARPLLHMSLPGLFTHRSVFTKDRFTPTPIALLPGPLEYISVPPKNKCGFVNYFVPKSVCVCVLNPHNDFMILSLLWAWTTSPPTP